MDCSMPGLPVHHQLLEFTPMHVHRVSDTIKPSLPRSLLLPPSTFPSIRVFSNESVLHIRWPKYWSFSLSISPSNEYSGLISFRIDLWLSWSLISFLYSSMYSGHLFLVSSAFVRSIPFLSFIVGWHRLLYVPELNGNIPTDKTRSGFRGSKCFPFTLAFKNALRNLTCKFPLFVSAKYRLYFLGL